MGLTWNFRKGFRNPWILHRLLSKCNKTIDLKYNKQESDASTKISLISTNQEWWFIAALPYQLLLANSLVYPERIQRGKSGLQLLKRSLSVLCLFFVSKFSNFYTVQYRRVQYSTGIYLVPRYYSVV